MSDAKKVGVLHADDGTIYRIDGDILEKCKVADDHPKMQHYRNAIDRRKEDEDMCAVFLFTSE